MSSEKLQLIITELEQANNELKQKYKSKKAQLEKTNKDYEDLSREYSRSKQSWQHREYELAHSVKEKLNVSKGMEQLLNQKHQEAYRELIQMNQEILSQQLTSLTNLPNQITSLTQTNKKHECLKEEIMKSFKIATEQTIKELEESRLLELSNQKAQYEYWLTQKEEKLEEMSRSFNSYRVKKANQLKRCELEIIKLFQYVDSLETILRKAENGEYYTQRIHTATATNTATNTRTSTGGGGGGGGGVLGGAGGTTLIIPKGAIPTRPTIERKGELDLSRKILRRFQESQKKDAKAQSEAIEALLGHCGMKSEDYANPNSRLRQGQGTGGGGGGGNGPHMKDLSDQELEEHIRGLITSPSMGRDLIVTAAAAASAVSSHLNGPHVLKSSTEKRHSLFNPIPTLPPPSNQGPRGKQMNKTNTATAAAAAAAGGGGTGGTGTPGGITAQGTPARTIQALNQNRMSNDLKNISSEEEEENFLFDDQEGLSNYQFPSHTDPSSGQIASSIYETDNAMIYSPSNTTRLVQGQGQGHQGMLTYPGAGAGAATSSPSASASPSHRQPYQKTSSLRAEEMEELFVLRDENLILKEKLNQFEQFEREKILETVEGNETIEYIKQLERESAVLRENIQTVAAQLQRSKVSSPLSSVTSHLLCITSFSSPLSVLLSQRL
jgi:chemotaxis protein histidine kinase CheA